jgi:hypothetical protein
LPPLQEGQVKRLKPVLNGAFRTATIEKQWVAKDEISVYMVNANFAKTVDFKGLIRIFSNMVAAQGSRHSLICLFETLFS